MYIDRHSLVILLYFMYALNVTSVENGIMIVQRSTVVWPLGHGVCVYCNSSPWLGSRQLVQYEPRVHSHAQL